MFGIQIDSLTLSDAASRIHGWMQQPFDKCRTIVTPNVDHVVMLQHDQGLFDAYQQADMILADGKPVLAASKLFRRALPMCVPGSDLVPELLRDQSDREAFRVYLLGAAPGVAERAAENIKRTSSIANVVGTYSPPIGFEKSEAECEKIIVQINQTNPDLLVVGLGAPKQELWLEKHRDKLKVKVAIGAGATIDFIAEEKKRAPKWLRLFALEWFHRMCSEPKRLVPRYARDAWFFPQILFKQWLRQMGFAIQWGPHHSLSKMR